VQVKDFLEYAMFIVHIAAEIAPVAKVGGLADVLLGFNRELAVQGHISTVVMPKYDCMDLGDIQDMQVVDNDFWSFGAEGWTKNSVWCGLVEGIPVFFIEPHNKTRYFERGRFYNCHDDSERFIYFARAALEFLLKSNKHPDIIHLHDWQTALVAPLYEDIYKPLGLRTKAIFLSIHNFEYQGLCDPKELDKIGLKSVHYLTPSKLQDHRYPSRINLLQGGIVYSNFVNTVSPTYAEEVIHPLGGKGLENILSQYAYKFTGILNGLDYTYWDPATDHYLPVPFSASEPASLMAGKRANKLHLKQRLSFCMEDRPIVSCIARLVPQKGTDLIYHAIFRTLERGGQFILLGTSPFPSINDQFHQLKLNLGSNPNVHFELNYNEELSHQIYAGSDMFIVPSLWEPCGLTQLIGLRYGTIPVVRKTGGLADTVFDVEYSGKPLYETNGFTFDHPNEMGVNSALDRAIDCWFKQPEFWEQLVLTGMRMDYSWERPTKEYIALYEKFVRD
jgi:starch synthase